jgi:hypothetical protein
MSAPDRSILLNRMMVGLLEPYVSRPFRAPVVQSAPFVTFNSSVQHHSRVEHHTKTRDLLKTCTRTVVESLRNRRNRGIVAEK